MKWSPWTPISAAATRKFQVTLKPMKLEGFDGNDQEDGDEERKKVIAIKIRWKGGPKSGLIPFHRTSKLRKDFSSEKIVKKGEPIEWDNQFENICSFSMVSNDHKFVPWDVSFNILYGDQKAESKAKLAVIGKVSLNLAEMGSKMESQIERKLPIGLQIAGVAREATLSVSVSIVEIRDSQDSLGIVQNSTVSREIKGLTAMGNGSIVNKKKEKKKQLSQEEVSLGESDVTFDGEMSSMTESGSSRSCDTQLDTVKAVGFLSWKRRRLGFKPARKTSGHSHSTSSSSVDSITSGSVPKIDAPQSSSESEYQDENGSRGNWETKELVSRDGQTKLRAEVFFASFDQRSEKAAGESACTALVAVISHWLQSNPDVMPTRSEFDSLIIEGSSEWRKLCDNTAYVNDFPDKHFDLETVLRANLQPIAVLPEKSFIGFFGPEKFESLKGAMSFDEIWNEISGNTKENEPRIYIVSWNDHFFVLKADANAYYIIDTLGERLFEGCNQAYILRFDDSALMHGKTEEEKANSEEMARTETTNPKKKSEEIICTGKECCRQFIKRFLASIPLRELEVEEKRETVSYYSLHQRLQIEFNFSSSLSSSSSSSSASSLFSGSAFTSTSSLLLNEECF